MVATGGLSVPDNPTAIAPSMAGNTDKNVYATLSWARRRGS
ncbi:MAG: hypothetical protein ACP5O1_04330 [Phycisphaerae bacterium]